MIHGKNHNGEFYEHKTRDGKVLIQCNRLGIWHAYLNTKWLQSFTSQESALHWFNERCKTDAKADDKIEFYA